MEVVHLALDNLLGQPELGNAIHENSARLVERLENRHIVAEQNQIARHRQPEDPRPDGNLLAIGGCFSGTTTSLLSRS